MRLATAVAVVLAVAIAVWGCQMRPGRGNTSPQQTVQQQEPPSQTPQAVAPKPQRPQPKQLPPLRSEPQLDVLLLLGGTQQSLTLLKGASVAGRQLPPGTYRVGIQSGQVVISSLGVRSAGDLLIDLPNHSAAPTFTLPGRAQQYGGDLVVKVVNGKVAICERIGMEAFLPGVLVKEMGGSWPLEALKAQAVAARSYIASQYLRRHDKDWHLAAAERVDLAYAGFIARPHVNLQTALRQTRGDLLVFRGLPLTAWFHSCSGGRTADKREAFPSRMAADGVTDPAPAMPSVRDLWAAKGAVGLNRPRVLQWTFSIPGDALSWRIRKNALAEQKRLGLGSIQRIDILSRHASGRAHQLAVSHDGPEGGGRWLIDAYQFRLWAGSHDVRSTWWTELRSANGTIFFAGKGFGHGVGMSQISAWAMAQEGLLASRILKHFYPGAQLVRRW